MSEISPEDLRRLLAEYADLADRLDTSEADRDRIAAAWKELRGELDAARDELETTRQAIVAAEARADSLQQERDRLSETAALSDAQLAGAPGARVLPPAEVSALVDRLLSSLGSRLAGMTVSDAEMRLKVAVEKVGEVSGFVVPGPESPPEVRESLHEITVRLHRTPE